MLKLKWYFKLVKEEIYSKVLNGDAIPEFYYWKRLDELIRGENAKTTQKDKEAD